MTDPSARDVWPDLVGHDAEGPFLSGGRCGACNHLVLQVRDVCPRCWREGSMRAAPIGRAATLYSYTVNHAVPPGFDGPVVLALLDLDEGIRVLAPLEAAPAPPRIGARAELHLADLCRDRDGKPLRGPRYRLTGDGEV